MNYIVLDLEWNQGTVENTIHEMPFEIVEIGAVKLNGQFEIVDTFQILIRPSVYMEMSQEIHTIVHLSMEELCQYGVPFTEAAGGFFEWCGREPYRFCTWGSMDLTELQRNLVYFHVTVPFSTPVFYYNIQRCFAIQFPDMGACALEAAVERLNFAKGGFHRALDDAQHTARILKRLNKQVLLHNYSVDCYHNPQKRSEELHLTYTSHYYYVSREFASKEQAMQDKVVRSTRCYLCGQPAKRRIRWYAANSRVYYCQAWCPQHGFIVGKIRMKKTDAGGVYAEKFLKLADRGEAERVRMRREEIRIKRSEKRKEIREKKARKT